MKTKPNWIPSCLLGVALLLLPMLVPAQTYTNSYGIWNYSTNGAGTCIITGYSGSGGAVTIPGTIGNLMVTGIGNGGEFGVFFENSSLTSVTITNGVARIGDGTFADCANLTSVTLGNSVATIGDGSSGEGAFQGCTSLAGITIPDSVTNLGSQAFLGCSGLTNAIIGNGVTSIGGSAFYDCSSLAHVTLGNHVASIGDSAFLQCYPLTGVTIPNSVITIADDAFFYCQSMTNVTFGTNVTSIGARAFGQCYGLTSITFPASVTSLAAYSFYSCVNLKSVYFQGNAIPLAGGAFFYDNALSVIYYLPGTSGWGPTVYGITAVMLNPPNPAGSLQVNQIPTGANWQVDGGILQPGGATVFGLAVGNHTVSFGTVAGWMTPADQTVYVGANVTNVVNAAYVSQPPLEVTTTALGDGMIDETYDQQLFASYGQSPYAWSLVSGSLPAGLTLGSDGSISGTPTSSGTFNFSVQVTDAFLETATQALSLTIQNPVIKNYSVTESWSVTLTVGTGSGFSTKTYKGTEKGTLTTTNDAYALINATGSPLSLQHGSLSRTMDYDYFSGEYEISGSLPGVGGLAGKLLVIAPLNFFVIAVPTGYSQGGFSSGDPNYSQSFFGASPDQVNFSGSGVFVDINDPDTSVGYVNEIDESSTATLTEILPPPPKITIATPSQSVSNAMFTVLGTATDSATVGGVYYQLNGTGWNPVTSFDGINWSAVVSLTPGNNTFQAYAVDGTGNVSLTNTVKVDYILSSTLTVLTNGSGTITPAYNGKTLAIGNAYSLTAKANKGFGFVNWTDGLGDVITNGTTLKFIMASNLTFVANFADNTRPTLSITNPAKTGARWSNMVFTVSGKSGDNVVVSNVWVSLNLGTWTPATLSNHGSNWLEQVKLVPGTNSLAVYAMDISGNFSLTNTVKVDYVVSAPMVVQIVGTGTVSPNYNGALLAISNHYTMKATAGKGFGFNYWSGGVPMTTASTLTFTTASNLTIIANFKDVTPPLASIIYPTANQKWSNAVITVTGKTSDNVGVIGVGVQINHGSWVAAQMAAGNTNWSAASLPVSYGTNLIQAYAMDAAGNVSLTNTVKILGVLAPASLSGYMATLKPAVGKQDLEVTWGDDTWSQAGIGSDTNANDYAAGSYTYIETGPNTAVLTNEDIGMLSALGTTNVTTVNLTFTGINTANYAWTNDNESGSGTMTFAPVSDLVPPTLAGRPVQIFAKTTLITTIAFANDGTFTKTNSNANYYGNYTFTQYSPTVAVIQLNHTDATEYGAAEYLEFEFTSATAGQGFGSYYTSPIYGSNPDDFGLGTFKLK